MREEQSEMSGNREEGKEVRWSPDPGGTAPPNHRAGADRSGSDPSPPFSDRVLENVLENVLCFLTSRRDRNAASLVCKSWYRAEAQTRIELFIGNCYAVSPARAVDRFRSVRSLVLKGKPRFADFNLIPMGWGARFSPWVAAMGSAYPWLERVCLKRMTVLDADLVLIAASFLSFRGLSLICCDGFTTVGLAAITENCRHLRSLDLIENDVEESVEIVDWLSKFPPGDTCLESLVFDHIGYAVNLDSLKALVARSPYLRQLRVNDRISAGHLCQLMARAPQLTHLGTGAFRSSVEEGDFEATLESAFSSSKSLVALSGFHDLSTEYLYTIYPVCANLTLINFSYAEITADQLKPFISRCHNLQTFWVLDVLGDEGLQMVAAACKKLKEIRVFPLDSSEDSESPVSDIGLTAISEGCRELQSILYFCQRMTNAAVIAMSMNCQDLVVFRLCIMGRHCPDRLTGEPMDEGFGAIVKNCKKLRRLAVSGLLTDRAFAYIGRYGKLVRTLSVAFAGDSDLGLRHVLEGCPKLQKLEIRDCPFGDAGLISGLHHYYNMRFLWMSSCKLSMNGCEDLAQRLPGIVVEVIRDNSEDDGSDAVGKLYMYRSLVGPRNDAPTFVKIL